MSDIIMHKHHIIPRYRCKEMGLDPDFDPLNIIEVTSVEHAHIHWLRYLKNGRLEELWAAQLLAKGAIDGIDISGENNPNFGKFGEDHPAWGYRHSAETIEAQSLRTKGEGNPMWGKKHTEETRELLSEAKRGKNNPMWGKKRPDVVAFNKSKEKRAKQSARFMGQNNPMSKTNVAKRAKEQALLEANGTPEEKKKIELDRDHREKLQRGKELRERKKKMIEKPEPWPPAWWGRDQITLEQFFTE